MTARNPFTTLTNLSFTRNCSRLDPSQPHPSRRPTSPYFPQSKPSFIHDPYLSSYNSRLHQELQYSQTLGIETLRYTSPSSSSEYYSLENYKQQSQIETIYGTIPVNKNAALYSSTGDMFGSDFFPRVKDEQGEDIVPKKTTILRKDTGGSSRLKFKKVEMDEDAFASKMVEQNQSLQQSRSFRSKQSEVELPTTLYLKSKKKLFYLQKSYAEGSMTDL